MPIRAVMFDLGNTLMHAVEPDMWPIVIRRGNQALMDYLCNLGYLQDCDSFLEDFNQRLRLYYARRDAKMIETSTFLVLKELLAEKGYDDISDYIVREALDAHYAVTQKNWQLEDDTIDCLNWLWQRGIRMGIVSNAGDHQDVAQLIDRFEIRLYFDFILTSAVCGYRKPHPRIFELAMEHFNVPPMEVAMVGDMLDADVQGANDVGIYSIWINRRVPQPKNKEEDGELAIQPQAVISSLSALPPLIEELEQDIRN